MSRSRARRETPSRVECGGGKAMVAKMIRPVRARAVLLVVGEEGMSTVE
jgi:hypothetical protein